jgi:aspartate kinase
VLVVQKYGGTSVGTPKRIQRVADRIAARHRAGDRVVVVVSAMGRTTDRLLSLAAGITDRPSRREMDMLLTAGERISMALLSMALETRGVAAISFTGSQSGIITDTAHTRARILEIRPIRIGPELDRGRVVIVAGFQGVSREKEVTTLGRGGSDTSAVALAVGLGADLCEIYTDVAGVMTADPRTVPAGRLLRRVSWDTMLELACHGAGVMHARAVELARRRRLPFQVRSTFRKGAGTLVEGQPIEAGPEVAAVTGRERVAEVRMQDLEFTGDSRIAFFDALDTLLEEAVALHQYGDAARTHLAFHMPVRPELEDLLARLQELAGRHGGRMTVGREHASVSVVGTGVLDAPAVAARAQRALAGAGIVPSAFDTGNLSLTFLVPRASFEGAQQALHREFLEPGERP